VTLTKGAVGVDGHEVARTEAIEESNRVQKIDGLFDVMRPRRFEDEADGASSKTVDLEVEPDISAIAVKSAFQTLSFARHTDVQFVLEDGGKLRVP
jgi:hypothetical protein